MDTKNSELLKVVILLLGIIILFLGFQQFQKYQQKQLLEYAVRDIKNLPQNDRHADGIVMGHLGNLRAESVFYQNDNDTLYAFCESGVIKDFKNELSRIGANTPVCSVTNQGTDFQTYVELASGEYYCVTQEEQERLSKKSLLDTAVMSKSKLTDKEIESLNQLGEVLYSIAQRLVDEGKAKVVDGKIIFLDDEKEQK